MTKDGFYLRDSDDSDLEEGPALNRKQRKALIRERKLMQEESGSDWSDEEVLAGVTNAPIRNQLPKSI